MSHNEKPVDFTVYGAAYPHTNGIALLEGGLKISHIPMSVSECFKAILTHKKLDAAEFSLANIIMLADRNATDYVALPIFPYRAFRHDTVRVRKESMLQQFEDLRGKRIALPDYSMTAAVWTRGIFNEVMPGIWKDVEWILKAPQRFEIPKGVKHSFIDVDAETSVLSGLTDAVISPDILDNDLPEHQRQLRELPVEINTSQQDWGMRYGMYPINHVVVMHREVIDRFPDAPLQLLNRFDQALAKYLKLDSVVSLVNWKNVTEKQVLTSLGRDPFAYGLSLNNVAMLEKFTSYIYEQKLVKNRPTLSEVFPYS